MSKIDYLIKELDEDWKRFFEIETEKDYFNDLVDKVKEDYKNSTVFPNCTDIFNAFKLCKFKDVKVVILGQDPYHGYGQANGLAFAVNKGMEIPPSLRNIFKEIKFEYEKNFVFASGDLTPWAKQGVLLLNSTLTVIEKKPNSHSNIGWETFTNRVIEYLSNKKDNLIFVLWGNNAKRKKALIDVRHHILTSPHPSPLSSSRGFFWKWTFH